MEGRRGTDGSPLADGLARDVTIGRAEFVAGLTQLLTELSVQSRAA